MSQIRVLLAEDHTIVRKGLRALLEDEADIAVVGEAEDGRKAVEMVEQLCPDVALMDITMPILNGLEATRQIKQRFRDVRVLVLTRHTNEEYVHEILRAGASGYVVKQAAPAELVLAIRAAYRGDSYLSPSISSVIVQGYIRRAEGTAGEDSYEGLTPREREVLQLIAEGYPNREIAKMLHISVKTVEHHRSNLLRKLDLHGTAELTQYAIRTGVIHLEP